MPGATVGRGDAAGRLVVVVGDVMVDVLVRVAAPFAHASDTASAIATAPGGSAANLAVRLSRAGARVAIVASVGEDPLGAAAIAALRGERVDVAGVVRAGRPTGTVVALVEPDGQRSMLTDRGANLALGPRDVEVALRSLGDGDHVHVSGYCLLDEATRPAGLRALELAAEAGATRSVDASSAGPLRALGPERFVAWMRGADLAFCNLDEARLLTGRPDARGAAEALATTVHEAVVTDGARGAVIAASGEVLGVDAAVGPSAADTTGAGDAFNGTYLARRLGGDSITAAATAATAAAASAVATTGARSWGAYSRV